MPTCTARPLSLQLCFSHTRTLALSLFLTLLVLPSHTIHTQQTHSSHTNFGSGNTVCIRVHGLRLLQRDVICTPNSHPAEFLRADDIPCCGKSVAQPSRPPSACPLREANKQRVRRSACCLYVPRATSLLRGRSCRRRSVIRCCESLLRQA